jgi:CheY-like chemotaxis protein
MKKKIIIVEDDPDILFALSVMLEDAGYDIVSLTSGQPLLSERFTLPALFILDKRMPDMDGLDLCRHLRAVKDTCNIPIIVISASPRFGPLALEAGANDFLEKPFTLLKMRDMVSKYI